MGESRYMVHVQYTFHTYYYELNSYRGQKYRGPLYFMSHKLKN
jgi:hypothetical protein